MCLGYTPSAAAVRAPLLTLPSWQWPRNRTGKRDQVQSPRLLDIAVICHMNDMADVYSVVAKQIGACSHTVLLAALSSDRTSAEPWIAPSMAWTLHSLRLWFLCSAGACHCVSLSTVYASTGQVPWSSLDLRSDSIHMLAPVG